MEVHQNRFAVLRNLDGDNNDLSSLLAKAAAKPEAATEKQKQQKKQNRKAAAAAAASSGSAANGFPSRPAPPSRHGKNFPTAPVPPTERGRGTGSNNDRWINNNKKNPSTGGRSNTGFPPSGKEETGTSATNSDSSTRGVPNRSAGEFPRNKTVEQADYEDNKLTFAEYEKSIQEKRKAIEALKKTEERKVTAENQFEGMLVTGKKKEDDVQVNMQKSGKNKAKKDNFEKEKMVCKTVSIGRFQIPAKEEAARKGRRGGHRGGGNYAGGRRRDAAISSTQDDVDFPLLRPAADAIAKF